MWGTRVRPAACARQRAPGSVRPVTPQERFVSNDGIRIRYLDSDPPDAAGLPVVFVPGVTDFADEYDAVFDLFDPRRLVVIELRGRGGSDAPPTGYSVKELASDVEVVLEAQGLQRFHLMTFSRGTTPAIEVALADPARVVTVSIGDYLPAEIGLGPAFVDSQWASRFRGRPMPERLPRHVLEQVQAESRSRELWDELAGLGVPVLVARGSEGGIVSDEQEARYRARIPGVEVVTIPGAAHDLFRPDRTAYPRAVLDLIARRAHGT
jgi:non-heme chloroperoxidase